LELVGSSRASKSKDFAYGNKLQDISKQKLKKMAPQRLMMLEGNFYQLSTGM
jgi:hypothetical protein